MPNPNAVVCHITVEGRPFCLTYQPEAVAELRCCCGHTSLASARRDQKKLQAHYNSVRVVRGHCTAQPFAVDWEHEDEPRPGIQIIVLEKHLKRAIELLRETTANPALAESLRLRQRIRDFIDTVEGTL